MIEVYTDGASAGNPGPSGAGVYIKSTTGKQHAYAIPLGTMSNHEAEYYALIHALKICIDNNFQVISCKTDSQLVEQAVNKGHINNEQYKPLLNEILTLIEQFELFFIKWIPSKQNKNADELARSAIQKN